MAKRVIAALATTMVLAATWRGVFGAATRPHPARRSLSGFAAVSAGTCLHKPHNSRFAHVPRAAAVREASRFPFSARSPAFTATAGGRAKTSLASTATEESRTGESIPITLLSGFLGSGKTSALKHLLENKEGVKVGVIVNDVASVNIDAKLLASNRPGLEDTPDSLLEAAKRSADGTVELQNGCACCSIANELLSSVQQLASGRKLDAIVVELSGVADPVSVRDNWKEAKLVRHPATQVANVERVVTVIDSATFGTDWMTWNRAGDRDGWADGDYCAAERDVPELLAEQVEAADVLLMNKIDMASSTQVQTAATVARALNHDAKLFEVEFGGIAPQFIIGDTKEAPAEKANQCQEGSKCNGHSHAHDHDHDHDHEGSCVDPKCTDPTHDHAQHSHAHTHENGTHDHSHHDHSHDHGSTSIENLGITNFAYRADRPFDTNRLLHVLRQWPVPVKDELDLLQLSKVASGEEDYDMVDGSRAELGDHNPFVGVLRSKGFCWMAPTNWVEGSAGDLWRHDTAMFWSHAGKHFGITSAGRWWGSISLDQMKSYFEPFGNMAEYNRILAEDWASDEWGDRRQELVFIGANLSQQDITNALDSCLLTDEEMDAYRQKLKEFQLAGVQGF